MTQSANKPNKFIYSLIIFSLLVICAGIFTLIFGNTQSTKGTASMSEESCAQMNGVWLSKHKQCLTLDESSDE